MTIGAVELPSPFRANPFERALAIRISLGWESVYYILVTAAAIGLRFWELGVRALHHDESIHAQWSWSLLQGNYHQNPIFHGPLYYHLEALVYLLFGANDYTTRISAAVFGVAMVLLPLLLRRRLGRVGTMAAVAFLAFSPTLVYYSRFFREDIYMAFFTLLMVVGLWRYMDEGRLRWLAVFAAGFTGGMLAFEGMFIMAAVFLLFLDVYLAEQLAETTLRARGFSSTGRRVVLTAALTPWAFIIAALWPLIGRFRRSMDWDELPRSGDLLIMLGTLTLPLMTPLSRVYILEPLHLVKKDQLNWAVSLQNGVTLSDGLALAGLFAITLSIVAFVGLQWRPKFWTITFLSCAFVYLTLMTSCWTNLAGLVSGPWGSLDYWQTQQAVARGGQPWYYYDMLMPMYEFLPLVLCIGGIWWTLVRGNAFSRSLWVWLVATWIALSWAGEKMPWLNVHLALPACMLAAYTAYRAWQAWPAKPALPVVLKRLLAIALISAAALIVIAWLPASTAANAGRVAIFVVAVVAITAIAWKFGRKSIAAVVVVATVGALTFFSFRTMIMVSFTRGDVPKDMLIYTQTAPQLRHIDQEITHLAAASGLGYNLPIAVDSTDAFSWPWAWYLRDYKDVTYTSFQNGPPAGNWAVLLVNAVNVNAVNQALVAQNSTQYGSPVEYPHRWWFDEVYRQALSTGPYQAATWTTIWDGITQHGWLDYWFHYWRDHNPGQPPGSANAYAYFPATFNMKTGMMTGQPVAPPKPTTDSQGHPQFGGTGTLPGQFFAPVGIAQDAQGNLYVVDSSACRLEKFDSHGNFLASVDIRNNPANTNEACQPWGVALAPNGTVVVADTFGWRIKEYTSGLKFNGVEFGQPPSANAAPGPYTLYGPRAVAFDARGNMWVTDTGDDRIQVYTLAGKYVRTIGGLGSGPDQFHEPVGISIAKDGTVYVADMYNSRVEILNSDGSYRGQFTVNGWGGHDVLDKPYLLALSDGRVAVDMPLQNEVRIYTAAGTLDGTISDPQEPINRPYGLTQAPDGKLWIVEGGSGRIREFAIPPAP